jgi:phosphoglycolate phosphatase-like HAD superfamily hydrolase
MAIGDLARPMTSKTLVLFDMDDTLVKSHAQHVLAFRKVFAQVYGVDASIEEIYASGLTTQAVIEKTLELHEISKEEVIEKIDEATDVMAEFFEKKTIKVLPGVKLLLKALEKEPDIILGVATGANEKIAKLLLTKTGLLEHFKILAFGDRTDLRRVIIERAIELAATPKLVIIGDSIHDMEMAKIFNAVSIAVSTGATTRQKLKDEFPDYLFNTLKNTDKVLKAILKKI